MIRSKISRHSQRLHFQSGLFADLAPHREIQRLANLQQSARQRPPAFQRLLSALGHQDAIAPQQNPAHADERPRG